MIIDVIDATDHHVKLSLDHRLKYVNSKRIEIYAMSNGVSFMINEIISALGSSKLELLRIWGHGVAGVQMVSTGNQVAGSSASRAAITLENIGEMEPILIRIRNCFAPNARVELRGCKVASYERGQDLIVALAKIWGVPVQAGIMLQDTTGWWTGNVIQATPSGALSTEIGLPIVHNLPGSMSELRPVRPGVAKGASDVIGVGANRIP